MSGSMVRRIFSSRGSFRLRNAVDSVKVKVLTLDSELEFSIRPTTTGKQLLDQVARSFELGETWFFGLQYTDTKDVISWLKLDKEILQQVVKQDRTLQFRFLVKFYPEEAAKEVIQDVTLRLLYLQIKDQIINGELYCPPESSILLASYAVQAKFGDYNEKEHTVDFLLKERLIPQRVLSQYRISIEDWGNRIINWWADRKGLKTEAAMREYIKIAEKLDMYGISYFEIQNKKGSELYLGIFSLGLHVYEKNNKLSPRVTFLWSEIRSVSYVDKRFVIKPVDKKSPEFIFYAPCARINKRILSLCMGNHEMYMRRRKPDTLEVQKLKQQVHEEHVLNQTDQERLLKEIEARKEAEEKQHEYEAELAQMREDMKLKEEQMSEANDFIRDLQYQIDDLNKAKEVLKIKEEELEELKKQLNSERVLSEKERELSLLEVSEREAQVSRMRTMCEEQTHKVDELQRKLKEQDQVVSPQSSKEQDRVSSAEHTHSDRVSSAEHNQFGQSSRSQSTDYGHIEPQSDHEHVIKTSPLVNQQLEELSNELHLVKVADAVSDFDALHLQNKRAGRVRSDILRQTQAGNVKKRIDQFENL